MVTPQTYILLTRSGYKEVLYLVTWLTCKHEHLHLTASTHITELCVATHIYNIRRLVGKRWVDPRACWPTSICINHSEKSN